MYLMQITNQDRQLLNKAKSKILLENPNIKNLSYGKTIQYALKKYIGEKNE